MYAGTVCALRVVAQHGFRYWLSYGPPDARWPADTPPTHPPTFAEFVAPPQPEMLVDGLLSFLPQLRSCRARSRKWSAGSDRTKRFLKLVAEATCSCSAFAW